MGAQKMMKKRIDKIEKLDLNFDRNEIQAIIKYFDKMTESNQKDQMEKKQIRDLIYDSFGIIDEDMIEQMSNVFDQDSDGVISLEDLIQSFSIFLRGNREDQLKFVFR